MAVGFITASSELGRCTPLMYAKYKLTIVNGLHTTGDLNVDYDCDGRNVSNEMVLGQFDRNMHDPNDKYCKQYFGIKDFGGSCLGTLEHKYYVPKSWNNLLGTAVYSNDCVSSCEDSGKNISIGPVQVALNKYNVQKWTWW